MGSKVLVTGAGGGVGGVGHGVVRMLQQRGVPVRALVHHDDERAAALRATSTDVVVGDLTDTQDVARALEGCRRMYFGMSVSPRLLDAAVVVAAAAREQGDLEALVNMSQLTVSQMTLTSTGESKHQRLHLLAERVFGWAGLPVVHLRPTVFWENPIFSVIMAASIRDEDTIRLPFGDGRTSPIVADDVAEVVATVLSAPAKHLGRHLGRTYELTGPRSQDMNATADEFSKKLGRPIRYADVPLQPWLDHELAALGLEEHVTEHLATMARLHRENRYDRMTHDVEAILGRPAKGPNPSR